MQPKFSIAYNDIFDTNKLLNSLVDISTEDEGEVIWVYRIREGKAKADL